MCTPGAPRQSLETASHDASDRIDRIEHTADGCARSHGRAARVRPATVNKTSRSAGASGVGAERGRGAAGSAGFDGAEGPAAAASDCFTLDRYCANKLTEQSSEISAKEVYFTASEGHLASGQKLVIALLIEPKKGNTKLLRVTLPLGVALVPGARIVIDEKEAMTAPYVVCLPQNGCMADYKAADALIEKLKNGRTLAIQAFAKGKPIAFTLPLTGFAKAYDGPASAPPTE